MFQKRQPRETRKLWCSSGQKLARRASPIGQSTMRRSQSTPSPSLIPSSSSTCQTNTVAPILQERSTSSRCCTSQDLPTHLAGRTGSSIKDPGPGPEITLFSIARISWPSIRNRATRQTPMSSGLVDVDLELGRLLVPSTSNDQSQLRSSML